MTGDGVLVTVRLRLVPATSAMITAELEHPDQLARVLGAELAVDWPPEHHGRDTLRFWRGALSRPGAAGWWMHYALRVRDGDSTLVGSVGYKGPPKAGVVEIGYSVVPSWQRQGLATEACLALIESAWRPWRNGGRRAYSRGAGAVDRGAAQTGLFRVGLFGARRARVHAAPSQGQPDPEWSAQALIRQSHGSLFPR